MSLPIDLDRQASRPLYQQIAEQIRGQISNGRLPTGTRLPAIRHLAHTLEVTRLTVHSAYNELQADGWIEATVGRGTFVATPPYPREPLNMADFQSDTDHVLDNMQRVNQTAGLHSLAYADPDSNLIPTEELWDSLAILRSTGSSLLRYGLPQGDPVLRVHLAGFVKDRGIEALPDEMIVTSGATQSLSLVTQALTRPGDCVVVEQPTYLGLLHILKAQGLHVAAVPLDDEGPQLEVLERIIIQQRPRFFYTIPSFHNPTGVCMSLERRKGLLALAARHGLMLLEDDVYGRLSYNQPTPPSLKSLDESGLVIYVDSFSKILMPGFRVGFVIAPPPLHDQLLTLRRAADLCGPPLIQRAVADFLEKGKLKSYLRRALPLYRERRDSLLHALQRWMPSQMNWTRPQGGFCCWLTIPRNWAVGDLYQAALQRGVVFTPGELFLAEADPDRHLRLCFGNQPPDVIEQCVAVLSELIEKRLEQRPQRKREAVSWRPLV